MIIQSNGTFQLFATGGYEIFKVNNLGTAFAKAMKVTLTNPFPDYVFKQDYHLTEIEDVASFWQKHHHLLGIPTNDEIQKDGLDLGDMQSKQMEKIEELYLYVYDLKKENQLMEEEIKELRKKIK